MCISGIYAFTNLSIVSVENEMNTGAVNIELKEYTINQDEKEVLYDEYAQSVLPGEVISLIPRITNLGEECYIRAKVSYTNADNKLVSADNNIKQESDNWIKCGEYWYYKLVVNSGENIDIFKSLQIPVDISNEYQGKPINLNITTEAVQAKNFQPDFDSDLPWKNINAKKATNEIYHTDKVQLNSNVKIEYENNADYYINISDDFFGELSFIMPGDVITEEVVIENNSSNKIEYFVSTDKIFAVSEKASELLNKLHLIIKVDEEIIYNEKLFKIDNLSLGKFEKNSSAKLKFIVTVPEDLENEYSALNATLKWNFSMNVEENVESPEEKPKDEQVQEPQTGDIKTIIIFTIFFISAIGLIVSIILEKFQKTTDKK